MAATLPAISSPGAGAQGGSIPHRLPEMGRPSASTTIITARMLGSRGKEMSPRHMRKQPPLDKRNTAKYRNTYLHNLCLDMLQDGYHKSFAELFALIKKQNEERELAGPESALWNNILLENEHEKLDTLKSLICQAEEATRRGDFTEVYRCQSRLACYFQNSGDKWLADHFFSACLATSAQVEDDGGKMAAEGHCNVGLALEESGDYFGAAENLEQFYDLSQDKMDWEFEDGSSMHSQACNLLSRIYTTIARQHEAHGDLKQTLIYLKKAYEMARQGGDLKLGGESSYRLGIAYEKNKDSQTALLYLNGYLDICQNMNDSKGIGMACEAIAKSYESQGKIEESIKYLEMFVDIADKSKDDKATSQACSNLGAIFNSLGRYEQAVDYFNKAYNIARSMNDTETISSSRVLFGVAAAHKMLEHVALHIEVGTKPCLNRIVEWKDNRGDEFDKEIPDSPPPTPAPAEKKEEKTKEKKEGEEEKKAPEPPTVQVTSEEEPKENSGGENEN